MRSIALVEEAMVQTIRQAVGSTVRVVDTLGGAWTLGMFRRLIQMAPAIYVACIDGRPLGHYDYRLDVSFEVFYLVANQGSELAARRGDRHSIGLYEMLELTLPRLHGLTVSGAGTLRHDALRNLFADLSADLGGTIWAARYRASLGCDVAMPLDLAQFMRFDAEHELATGAPVAHDTVRLES